MSCFTPPKQAIASNYAAWNNTHRTHQSITPFSWKLAGLSTLARSDEMFQSASDRSNTLFTPHAPLSIREAKGDIILRQLTTRNRTLTCLAQRRTTTPCNNKHKLRPPSNSKVPSILPPSSVRRKQWCRTHQMQNQRDLNTTCVTGPI